MNVEQQSALLAEILNRFGFVIIAGRRRVPPGTVIPAGGWVGGLHWPRMQQPAVIAREATEEEWMAQFDWVTARLGVPKERVVPFGKDAIFYVATFD